MARNPDSIKEEQLASVSTAPVPAPAYNPMSGNPFVNAVGPSAVTPVTPATTSEVAEFTAAENKYYGLVGSNAVKNVNTVAPVDPAAKATADALEAQRKDAFALLEDTFNQFGLSELSSTIKQFMTENIGAAEAGLRLKTDTSINPATGKPYNAPYVARFAGNVARQKAGFNALSEGDYLALENEYSTLFKQYGLSSLASRTEAASLIGNDISKVELNSRLDLAVNQVANADPGIKAQLKAYYPGITDADLTQYFLKPAETLPMLQQKVTTAQIGAAAAEQGLTAPTLTRAEELAKLGVDQTAARTGYQKVAAVLPETQKLSAIYGETGIQYAQTQAEQEFLQGQQSVAKQRRQLSQLEQASFSGSTGIRTAGESLTKLTQGKF